MSNRPRLAEGPREPSKYAQKMRGRELGIIEPFEFKTKAGVTPSKPVSVPSVPMSPPQLGQTSRVVATVTKIAWDKGYLFLRSPSGIHIYSGLVAFRNNPNGREPRKGMEVDCTIVFGTKGWRIQNIFRVIITDD